MKLRRTANSRTVGKGPGREVSRALSKSGLLGSAAYLKSMKGISGNLKGV